MALTLHGGSADVGVPPSAGGTFRTPRPGAMVPGERSGQTPSELRTGHSVSIALSVGSRRHREAYERAMSRATGAALMGAGHDPPVTIGSARRLELWCAPDVRMPGEARRRAAKMLAGSPHLDSVLVLLSEVVTNALLHTTSPAQLCLMQFHRPDHNGEPVEVVRVEVRDRVRQPPEPRAVADELGGYGLRIVDALATRWGHQPLTDGKVVWFEVGGS